MENLKKNQGFAASRFAQQVKNDLIVSHLSLLELPHYAVRFIYADTERDRERKIVWILEQGGIQKTGQSCNELCLCVVLLGLLTAVNEVTVSGRPAGTN